jgi:transcriptional regulator with XRE-family HTH domain
MMDMTADTPARLAECLKGLRRRRRFSQKDLAEAAGLSRTLITNIERGIDLSTGRPPNPQPNTLRQLAVGLSTDGDGQRDPVLEEAFYADLMDAADYLPKTAPAWTMRGALHGIVPEADIEEIVAQYGDLGIADQQAWAEAILLRYAEVRRQVSDEMAERARCRNRPA